MNEEFLKFWSIISGVVLCCSGHPVVGVILIIAAVITVKRKEQC